MHNKILLLLLLRLRFFSQYIYSATHFAYTISHLSVYLYITITLLLRKMTWFCLYISHTFAHSYTVRESLSTSHTSPNDVVVNVFFFCFIVIVLSLSLCMSILTCFDSYKRERNTTSQHNAWINFFFILSSMYVCVCFLLRVRIFFFTYYQFFPSLLHFVIDKWK